uniref:Peptidyl-prolyl cis-trans isomerase n=1 Tax=Plectus sambesii TaxID=2011161 RepID=A0A914XHW9_9BILA
MLVGLVAVVFSLIPLVAQAGNNTITDEVFFDIKVDATEPWTGRIVIGVFGDALPITSFNFVSLAKGFKHREELWTYKNCQVHRIVPDFLIQTGDVVYRDGRGGRSVYAPYFIDEGFPHSHRAAGYVANANVGPDSNASQFYITLTKARWLDNRNVVFGKVIKGLDVVERLAKVQTDANGYPRVPVIITNSGTLSLAEPYDLTEAELDKGDDIRPGYAAPDFVEL